MPKQTKEEILKILEGEFEVQIPLFNKWNKDHDTTKWFRLDNNWMDVLGPKTVFARLCFVQLCTMAAIQWPNNCQTTVSKLSYSVRGRSDRCLDAIVSLCNEGVLFLRTNERTNRHTDITDMPMSSDSSVLVFGEVGKGEVIDELRSIDDGCLRQISLSVQRSWLSEYGLVILRSSLPTFYEVWKTSGRNASLPTYLRRCFENEKKYKDRNPAGGTPGAVVVSTMFKENPPNYINEKGELKPRWGFDHDGNRVEYNEDGTVKV